jgi:hypothetical protein
MTAAEGDELVHRLDALAKTKNADAIEVFFSSAMKTLASGGTAVGEGLRQHHERQRLREGHADRPRGLRLPGATELMPERTASATKAAV